MKASVEQVKRRGMPFPQCGAEGERSAGYWLVTHDVYEKTNVLIVELPEGERLLPVFSGAAEAEMFVRFSGLDRLSEEGWFARRTGYGELLSMLIGPRRSVRRIALDPSPELLGVDGIEEEIERVCVTRRQFVERLLSERTSRSLVTDIHTHRTPSSAAYEGE